MLTSKRGLLAANLIAGVILCSTPALAQDDAAESEGAAAPEAGGAQVSVDIDREIGPENPELASNISGESAFQLSGNVALVSEYRFRGVDLSGSDIAIQGGIDLGHDSGFYVGVWASSIDEDTVGFGHTELDLYGGWGGNIGEGLSVDLGVIGYIFPDAPDGLATDYVELYGSLSYALGPADLTAGIAYAPDQSALGDSDNLYLYSDLSFGIPATPVTVKGHLGYTDGFLTFKDNREAFDWSIGAEMTVGGPVSAGIAYVGAEGDFPPGSFDFTEDTVVFTLSASF